MALIQSLVINFTTGDLLAKGDNGIGEFWIKCWIYFDFPMAGIAAAGVCEVSAEGNEVGVIAPHHPKGDPLQLDGIADPVSGAWSTDRNPKNPAGGLINLKTDRLKTDKGRYISMAWEVTSDVSGADATTGAPFRTVEGEVYLKYVGKDYLSPLPTAPPIFPPYTQISSRIPFVISVHRAP